MLSDLAARAAYTFTIGVKSLLRPVCFGVAGAVMDQDGRVLLVRQTYMPGWRLPGGGVNRGEPPDNAARRELKEEVGLSGGDAALFGLYVARVGFATHLVSFYRVTGGRIDFRPNLEVREILYADPAAPPPGTAPSTLRRLRELAGTAPVSQFW